MVAALDDQGRWVERGGLKTDDPDNPTEQIIDCRTFAKNVQTLSEYLAKR